MRSSRRMGTCPFYKTHLSVSKRAQVHMMDGGLEGSCGEPGEEQSYEGIQSEGGGLSLHMNWAFFLVVTTSGAILFAHSVHQNGEFGIWITGRMCKMGHAYIKTCF